MPISETYAEVEPTPAEVHAIDGPAVLEFGSPWCGYCRVMQPYLEKALAGHPRVRHIKIADGTGRRLGRSYGVKLWPTLVFLDDGRETARLVRPSGGAEISRALAVIDAAPD